MISAAKIHRRKKALVIGATGGVGGAAARALLHRGWAVTALNRNPERASRSTKLQGAVWVEGDAMKTADVLAAAMGADLIVHAANPPGYRNWSTLVLPMLDNSIAAAKATGARILLPGTVYNYGPDIYGPDRLGPDRLGPGRLGPDRLGQGAGERRGVIYETSPQTPVTRKGKIRVEMERRLQASGVKTLIVRAGDFFGPEVTGNSWFRQMVRPGEPVRKVVYPGDRSVGHAWAYLPDLAETMTQLVLREEELEPFAVFNFAGHWFDRGEAMAQAILTVAEQPKGEISGFPWPLLIGLSPFTPLFREILEMRYLWTRPLRLDNTRLVNFLGEEPRTPIHQAVAATLDGLGCLKADWPLKADGLMAARASS